MSRINTGRDDGATHILMVDGWHFVEHYEEYENQYYFAGSQVTEHWFSAYEVNEACQLHGPIDSILAQRII